MILATGGPGVVYGRSTNSVVCTGTATTSAYLQGAKYGNGELGKSIPLPYLVEISAP